MFFKKFKTIDEVKAEYKRLAMKLHPDVSGYDSHADFVAMQNEFLAWTPQGDEKYKGQFAQWSDERDSYTELIENLMKVPNIEFSLVGSYIWITKSAKEVKDLIKEANPDSGYFKCAWARKKGMWFFKPANYRPKRRREMSYDQITDFFGEEKMKSTGRKSLDA